MEEPPSYTKGASELATPITQSGIKTERQRQRETERDRKRQKETERHSESARAKHIEGGRDSYRTISVRLDRQ